MYLKFGRYLFKKKLIYNMCIVIQLSATIILGNILFFNVNMNKRLLEYMSSYGNMYYSSHTFNINQTKLSEFNAYSEEYKFIPDMSYNGICTGKTTLSIIAKQLKKGEFKTGKNENNLINCMLLQNPSIFTHQYSIGDVISKRYIVTGILKANSLFLNPNYYESSVSTAIIGNLIADLSYSKNHSFIFFESYEEEKVFQITYFNEFATEKQREDAFLYLSSLSPTISVDMIKKNTTSDQKNNIYPFVPLLILNWLLTFFNFYSIIIFTFIDSKDVFLKCYDFGLMKKESILYCLSYLLYIILLAIVICVITFIKIRIYEVKSVYFTVKLNNILFNIFTIIILPITLCLTNLFIIKPKTISER